MRVLTHFDNAVARDHEICGEMITFDLRGGGPLNVLLVDPPARLTVVILGEKNLLRSRPGQGLITSTDGETFQAVAWKEIDAESSRLTAVVATGGRTTQVSLGYPYGRDRLDRLMVDTRAGRGRWDLLRRAWRQVPVYRIGPDDAPVVHWVIAAEDAWETAGAYAGDEMVRCLAAGRVDPPAGSEVCVVPAVSPYSLTQPNSSYTHLDGRGLYGAATWGDDEPPAEYGLLRDEVERAIVARRLGLLLTMHSWHALRPWSGLETIRTAGGNELAPEPAAWAARTMETLLRGVPAGRHALPEKIWHGGLAREWTLARHNAISFRIEITTADAGVEQFRETGRALLANIAVVDDWRPACGPAE